MDFSKLAIDVSLWDGFDIQGKLVTIDWALTGYPVAIIKSSQRNFTDPAFYAQWEAAKPIPRIAYHFFDATYNAIQQAEYCLSVVLKDFTSKDYLAVDLEHFYVKINGVLVDRNPSTPTTLMSYASMLNELGKKIPAEQLMIYTGASYWYPCGGRTATWAKKYHLWQAQYPWDNWLKIFPRPLFNEQTLAEKVSLIESGKAKPVECLPWDKPSIWQFTSKLDPRLVPSYKANKKAVDLNYVYMELGEAPQFITCPTCNGTGKVPA